MRDYRPLVHTAGCNGVCPFANGQRGIAEHGIASLQYIWSIVAILDTWFRILNFSPLLHAVKVLVLSCGSYRHEIMQANFQVNWLSESKSAGSVWTSKHCMSCLLSKGRYKTPARNIYDSTLPTPPAQSLIWHLLALNHTSWTTVGQKVGKGLLHNLYCPLLKRLLIRWEV
jgi:hypothetical protein